MPSSNTSVALSRPASFVGGVASLDGVAYAVIGDAAHPTTELIAITHRGDPGHRVGALPLDGVFGVIACSDVLVIAGGFAPMTIGAVTVSVAGEVVSRRDLAPSTDVIGPVIPLCLGGRATLVWREAGASPRWIATRVDDGARDVVLDDPAAIRLTAAAAVGQLLTLVRHPGGLRARAGAGPAYTVAEAAVDTPVLCAGAAGVVAAWTERSGTTIRLRRLRAGGEPSAEVVDVARAPTGEEVASLQLACGAGDRFAVLWQTASTITDPVPGDRTRMRFWVAFGDAAGTRAPVELPEGGPGAAAWRGDELVVVHGEGMPHITTLRW